jgi:predicted dehydrogenase
MHETIISNGIENMIKIGYIGVGWIADWHLQAMQSCEGIQVVGAATGSTNRSRFEARCEELKLQPYSSIEALLADEQVDAVAILSPTGFHFEQCIQALRAGKHVLVEKPVVLNVEQHRELDALARTVGKVLMPAHNFVYRPVVRKAREILETGALGAISYASFRAVHFIADEAANGWRKDQGIAGGGAMIDSGMHLVYQSLYLMGQPSHLSSFQAKKHYLQLDDEDISQISLQYPDGSIGLILQSWASGDGSAGEIRIQGDKGTLLITDGLYHDGVGVEADADYKDSFYHLACHFVACVEGQAQAISSMEDAAVALHLIQQAYEASEHHQVLSFPGR